MKAMKQSVDVVTDRVRNVEKDMHHFKQKIAEESCLPAQTPTATRSSPSSSTAPPMTSSPWTARICHVRVWSPCGSPPESKITKSEARELIHRINNLLNDEGRSQIRGLAPYAQHHQMDHQKRAEVFDAAHSDPKSMSDRVGLLINKNNNTARGCALRTGLEVSPQRRAILKMWYDAQGHTRDLNSEAGPKLRHSVPTGCGVRRSCLRDDPPRGEASRSRAEPALSFFDRRRPLSDHRSQAFHNSEGGHLPPGGCQGACSRDPSNLLQHPPDKARATMCRSAGAAVAANENGPTNSRKTLHVIEIPGVTS